MIKKEEINGLIFIAQTTFYIYKSEKDLQDGNPTLVCSEKKQYEANKKLAKFNEKEYKENKFIVI